MKTKFPKKVFRSAYSLRLRLTSAMFFSVLVASCGNQAEKQKETEIALPEYQSRDDSFALQPEESRNFYGTLLVWNSDVEPDELSQIVRKVEETRRINAEYSRLRTIEPKRVAEVEAKISGANKIKLEIEDTISTLPKVHYEAAWKAAYEFGLNWYFEIESQARESLGLTDEEINSSRLRMREICEGMIWKLAQNSLTRDLQYSSKPDLPPFCNEFMKPIGELPALMDDASPFCAPATEQESFQKDYFQCVWLEGVFKTRYFQNGFEFKGRVGIDHTEDCDLKCLLRQEIETGTLTIDKSFIRNFKKEQPVIRFKVDGKTKQIKKKRISGSDFESTSPLYKLLRIVDKPDDSLSTDDELEDGSANFFGVENSELEKKLRLSISEYYRVSNMEIPSLSPNKVEMTNLSKMYWFSKSQISDETIPSDYFDSFKLSSMSFPELFGVEYLPTEEEADLIAQVDALNSQISRLEVEKKEIESEDGKKRTEWTDMKLDIAANHLKAGAASALWEETSISISTNSAGETLFDFHIWSKPHNIGSASQDPYKKESGKLFACVDSSDFSTIDCQPPGENYYKMAVSKNSESGSLILTIPLQNAKSIGFKYTSLVENEAGFNHIIPEQVYNDTLILELYPRNVGPGLIVLTGEGKIIDANGTEKFYLAANLSTTLLKLQQ